MRIGQLFKLMLFLVVLVLTSTCAWANFGEEMAKKFKGKVADESRYKTLRISLNQMAQELIESARQNPNFIEKVSPHDRVAVFEMAIKSFQDRSADPTSQSDQFFMEIFKPDFSKLGSSLSETQKFVHFPGTFSTDEILQGNEHDLNAGTSQTCTRLEVHG